MVGSGTPAWTILITSVLVSGFCELTVRFPSSCPEPACGAGDPPDACGVGAPLAASGVGAPPAASIPGFGVLESNVGWLGDEPERSPVRVGAPMTRTADGCRTKLTL